MNDEAPWFELSEYEVQIRENQPAGTTILTVSATDRDQGERIFILGQLSSFSLLLL